MAHGVEQAFMPAARLIKKPALAAEVPDPGCRERKEGCAELYGYPSAVRARPRFTGFCPIYSLNAAYSSDRGCNRVGWPAFPDLPHGKEDSGFADGDYREKKIPGPAMAIFLIQFPI